MDKKGIRNLGKLLRKSASAESFGKMAYEHLKKTDFYKSSKCIMLYLNLSEEAPTEYLIEKMLSDGKRLCVPVTEGVLIKPCGITAETVYNIGAFSVREPSVFKDVKPKEIDLLIIPGLLFDVRGTRCGYGKGCYDRFLENINPIKVGLSFDKQLIKAFPSEDYDVKMDYILTEKGLICCEK